MQRVNLGAAAILAFGGFIETNALKINSQNFPMGDSDHIDPEMVETAAEELYQPAPEMMEPVTDELGNPEEILEPAHEELDLASSDAQADNNGNPEKPSATVAAQQLGASDQSEFRSISWDEPLTITFDNTSDYDVTLYWHDYTGNLVSYGVIAAHTTKAQGTYATHPWSVQGDGEFLVDGDAVWIPSDAAFHEGRKISIVRQNPDFTCDPTVNFIQHGPAYQQISLTDACDTSGVCDNNPVYASDGKTCDREEAIAYCQDKCISREGNGEGCEGFFYQKHTNGHEICGFYESGMDTGAEVWHGHDQGTICHRNGFALVTTGDCIGDQLIESAQECQAAIADVFGVNNAAVQEWNTPAYAKGCFKSNYGNPGSLQAMQAPTVWVFNHDGGPGTSGHCTGEPGYAACICRDATHRTYP